MHSILIVEDDMNINGLLKEALEKADYLCTQAFSGTEARMLLAMNRYSVVLLDLMLPGISDHIYIVVPSVCEKDVFKLVFVKNLEKLISLNDLTVGRRCYKRKHRILIIAVFRKG